MERSFQELFYSRRQRIRVFGLNGGRFFPVVIVTGSADRLLDPNEHAYPLQKTIRNSKLIVLPDTGHQLPQTKPDDVISAIDAAAASGEKS
jgi:pimeloyl-ACP methyl ester carboxylesterase